jgi:integrase
LAPSLGEPHCSTRAAAKHHAVRRDVGFSATADAEGRPNGARFFPPKTKASLRDIPIPPELVTALEAWRRECPTPMPLGLVFPKVDGSPMHRKTLRDHGLVPAIAKATLRHFTVHSLRHCFASSLAAAARDGDSRPSRPQFTRRHAARLFALVSEDRHHCSRRSRRGGSREGCYHDW